MGMLDEWSRRAISRREGPVEFLGEQNGSIEDTLKRDLILEFATRPDIRRAYLARVGFPPATESTMAVCILSKRPDDQAVVTRVGDTIRRRFSRDTPIEILFLTAEQDAELARVCRPFFSGAG
jgi:hypothetical protein